MQQKREWGSQGSTQACLRGLGPEALEALAVAAGGGRVEPLEAVVLWGELALPGARVMFTSVTRDRRAESSGCSAPVLAELCALRKHEAPVFGVFLHVLGFRAFPGSQSWLRVECQWVKYFQDNSKAFYPCFSLRAWWKYSQTEAGVPIHARPLKKVQLRFASLSSDSYRQ